MEFGCARTEKMYGVHQVIRRNREKAKQAEEMKLSKTFNTKIAKGRMDELVVHIIKGVLSYSGAIKQQYAFRIMEARIKVSVDYMMPLNQLTT